MCVCLFYVDYEEIANIKTTISSDASNMIEVIDKNRMEGEDEENFNDVKLMNFIEPHCCMY